MDKYLLELAYDNISDNVLVLNKETEAKLGNSAYKLQEYMNSIDQYRRGNNNALNLDEQSYLYEKRGKDCFKKIMLISPTELGIAYRIISENLELNEQYETLLQQRGVNIEILKDYIDRLNLYRNGDENALTPDEKKYIGEENLTKIMIYSLNTNNKGNSNSKVFALKNGNKQLGVDDEAAFSDIYMFAFLVLLFQVLFLVISYMIFSK